MKIKICGIKDEENLKDLCKLDIDYIGLIFAESKRKVSFKNAEKLSKIARSNAKKVVGVFVDEEDSLILEVCKFLDVIQSYKMISEAFFNKLKALNKEIWQVISVKDELILPHKIYCDYVLFDTGGKNKGGNGFKFDWNLLKYYDKDFILAGGIGLDNINDAIKTGAFVLDINSKVENEQFLKDVELVKKILKKVKQ
ncbi:phosphoribosylanthranilate isomerase [uncultured Campylobacter sp.]|uniref:phosphoribosylanthranilate isomerase n=1 Tax=uncultured Campylobacter sp. TaxID=218934 RepID=UPI00261C75C1|nr:phosphoribosylanthranilate isomerase [uncultured Campylobacter sp.]